MKKQTALQDVKNMMQEMKAKKAEELEMLIQKRNEAYKQLEAAELAAKDATERMDFEVFEDAKTAKERAKTAIDMYNAKHTQISNQEYINEAESNKVIDSLLNYEKEIEKDFKAKAAIHLRELETILAFYFHEVNETERIIVEWCNNIHANYRMESTMYFNKATGDYTNRSNKPVPVHSVPFKGCSEANITEEYLKQRLIHSLCTSDKNNED